MFGTSLEEGVGTEFELDMKSDVSIRMFAWTVPGHSCLFRGGMTWCLVWLVVRGGGGGGGGGGAIEKAAADSWCSVHKMHTLCNTTRCNTMRGWCLMSGGEAGQSVQEVFQTLQRSRADPWIYKLLAWSGFCFWSSFFSPILLTDHVRVMGRITQMRGG